MVNLKLYKKLNNIPRFNIGADGNNITAFKPGTGFDTLPKESLTKSTYWSPTVGNLGNNGNQLKQQITGSINPTYQNNSPGAAGSSGAGVSAGVGAGINIASSAVNFAGNTINSFSKNSLDSVDTLSTNAGTSNGYINGINYQRVNDIDSDSEMNKVNAENTSNTLSTVGSGAALGATVGSIIPGLGTVVGGAIGAVGGLVTGLFGGAGRKREAERRIYEAKQLQLRTNQFNRSSADTQGLQQDYARQYGDNDNKLLYANKGKDVKSIKRINNNHRLRQVKRKGC